MIDTVTGYEERNLDRSMPNIEYEEENGPGVWILFKEMRIIISSWNYCRVKIRRVLIRIFCCCCSAPAEFWAAWSPGNIGRVSPAIVLPVQHTENTLQHELLLIHGALNRIKQKTLTFIP